MLYVFCLITLIIGLVIGFLIGKLSINNTILEFTRLQEQVKAKNETIKMFQDMEKLVQENFTNIANKAIVDKQANLNEQNSKLLEPITQNIELFRKRLEDFSKEGVNNTQTIKTQIETLIAENKLIKNTASELTNALKENSQSRGVFGEIILENILKASGLKNKDEYGEEGNYITQTSYRDLNNPDAPPIRPDAVIFFPDNKHVIVDSKLALNDFQKFANETDKEEKQKHLKNFYTQVENMIEELGDKYDNLDGLHTPDFKFMFIPIEGILSYISLNQKLLKFANSKNVIITAPSTLLAALRIVNYCWMQKNQAENIAQILKIGESMYAKCVTLTEKIDVLKTKFFAVESYFDEVLKSVSGKGGITALASKMQNLGLNSVKKIPEKYLPDEE